MNGSYLNERRRVCQKETDYLNNLVRGIYARREVPKGTVVDERIFISFSIKLSRYSSNCQVRISLEQELPKIW